MTMISEQIKKRTLALHTRYSVYIKETELHGRGRGFFLNYTVCC